MADLILGTVFDGPCDLAVLPCSTDATFSSITKAHVDEFGIPGPEAMSLGGIQVIPHTKAPARFVAWCASVHNKSSSLDAIQTIGQRLGALTKDSRGIRILNTPILGSGAGGLTVNDSAAALIKGFQRSASSDAELVFYCPHADVFGSILREGANGLFTPRAAQKVTSRAEKKNPGVHRREVWVYGEITNDLERKLLYEFESELTDKGTKTHRISERNIDGLHDKLNDPEKPNVRAVFVFAAESPAYILRRGRFHDLVKSGRILIVVVGNEDAAGRFHRHHQLGRSVHCLSWDLLPSFASDVTSLLSGPFPQIESVTASVSQEAFDPGKTTSNRLPGFSNDGPDGESHVDIRADVEAIARVISMKQVTPPLSIAIFGNWGSGKSFFMRRIRETVKRIQGAAALDESTPFFSNVVQIEFNAWHYVEANLWASLVCHIFENLRKPGPNDAADREQAILLDRLGSAQKRRLEAEQQLESAKRKEAEAQTELLKKEEDRRQRLRTLQDVKTYDVVSEVLKDNEMDLVSKLSEVQKMLGFERVVKNLRDAEQVLHEFHQIGADFSKFIRAFLKAPGFSKRLTFVAFSIFALWMLPAVVDLVAYVNQWPPWSGILKWLLTFGATIGALIQPIAQTTQFLRKALASARQADERFTEIVRVKTKQHEDEVQRARDELTNATSAVSDAKLKVKEAEFAIAAAKDAIAKATPRALLSRFIEERAASDDYRKNLGMLALVRKDFETLSELMKRVRQAPFAPEHEGLPRIDRIILYIDDLDRCPPKQVVELLQAVHLLLAFELFVVIVGVDPRWVSHSLISEYPRLLAEGPTVLYGGDQHRSVDDKARPLDYLEKIFQIPFWVNPINKAAMNDLVRGVVGDGVIAKGKMESDKIVTDPVVGAPPVKVQDEQADKKSTPPGLDSDVEGAQSRHERYVDVTLLSDEVEFLKRFSHLAGETPRSLKRFVNIYRLLRARVPQEQIDLYLGEEGQPRDFEAVILLIGVFQSSHSFAKMFVSALDAENVVEGVAPIILLEEVLNKLKAKGGFDAVESKLANALSDYHDLYKNAAFKPTIDPFCRWHPVVSRFSFCGR